MAKKRRIGSKVMIDRLPVCVQQPRSPPRKRRTDFSLFFCSSDSFFKQAVALPDISNGKDDLSNVTIANLDDRKEMGHMVLESSAPQHNESVAEGQGSFSNFSEVSIIDTGSAAKDTHSGPSHERNNEQNGDTAQALECSPIKSRITDCNDVCTTPGSIVWAKTAGEKWWPAEVMSGRSTSANSKRQGVHGHVLVQYYGNNTSSWVDPAADLSHFDECFQERSCNPMEDFQEALNKALRQKEQINSCRQLFGSPNVHNNLSLPDQSSEKWNSSSSSRTEDRFIDQGRGKRKRMPKVRFDEFTFPSKSSRKDRRLRIMRHLGLAAPVGSPF